MNCRNVIPGTFMFFLQIFDLDCTPEQSSHGRGLQRRLSSFHIANPREKWLKKRTAYKIKVGLIYKNNYDFRFETSQKKTEKITVWYNFVSMGGNITIYHFGTEVTEKFAGASSNNYWPLIKWKGKPVSITHPVKLQGANLGC